MVNASGAALKKLLSDAMNPGMELFIREDADTLWCVAEQVVY